MNFVFTKNFKWNIDKQKKPDKFVINLIIINSFLFEIGYNKGSGQSVYKPYQVY